MNELGRDLILFGDCRETLPLFSEKARMCVTSPPYYGLRDYGTATWIGGDPECSHLRESKKVGTTGVRTGHANLINHGGVGDGIYKSKCKNCGAIREDKQIGLEETPEEYIDKLVEVFRKVRDCLTDDGTLWLNIGDSYAGSGKGPGKSINQEQHHLEHIHSKIVPQGTKPKDLIGIPWMLAFALRADGWYLRQDIIWHKPNPMPESVKDRCTKAHEYIFLLSKNKKYHYDHEAIKEPATWVEKKPRPSGMERNAEKYRDKVQGKYSEEKKYGGGGSSFIGHSGNYKANGELINPDGKRNKRSVWTINTKPYKGAHFAVFPADLIEPCILAGSEKGDTVLDPFMGSGTTAMVAKTLGRHYMGCEMNKDYGELIQKRIDEIPIPDPTLFDDPQLFDN